MPNSIGRRGLIRAASAAGAVGLAPGWAAPARAAGRNPFSLGVASGEPRPDGVVIWTRLAPAPLDPDGGMPARPVTVDWQMAADPAMTQIVRTGRTVADPARAHAVHVAVDGLRPQRPYWYRFEAGGARSPVGRTRTAPHPDTLPDTVRIAVASCQRYEDGYYTAHRHMARDNPDLVLFLGDYIYETHSRRDGPRRHKGPTATTLAEYRRRYAQYKTDPDLQACHAAAPWLVTWDDHEVANNYAGAIPPASQASGDFLARRAAAYQAFYEHMPLRESAAPAGPDMTLYRTVAYGRLVRFHLLDTRQYRAALPCAGQSWQPCPAAAEPGRTLLGAAQEDWLAAQWAASPARWNVLAQQVPVMQRRDIAKGRARIAIDKWDGYPEARARLLAMLAARPGANPVVLSGDVHEAWAGDLKADFDDPSSPPVAAEFTATSISSNGDGRDMTQRARRILAHNPHIRHFSARRGYTLCDITPARWTATYREVDRVETPGGGVSTRATFSVNAGTPGIARG